MAREYYRYDPSLPAAIIFTILFILSAAVHAFQLVKSKTWYFVPFLVGCLCMVPYPRWLPRTGSQIFFRMDRRIITNDYKGGGKLANAETPDERDQAQTIIIIGLAIQIVFFSLFMAVTCVFHYRINKKPTAKSSSINSPWDKLLLVLYASSLLILVRSVFRVVEYVTGHDGEIQSKEVYIYIFDALLMAIVVVIFNIFHPSEVLSIPGRDRPNYSDSEMPLGAYGISHWVPSRMAISNPPQRR
ncbi:rta1 domain-containing protein [Ilyonectria robusta]